MEWRAAPRPTTRRRQCGLWHGGRPGGHGVGRGAPRGHATGTGMRRQGGRALWRCVGSRRGRLPRGDSGGRRHGASFTRQACGRSARPRVLLDGDRQGVARRYPERRRGMGQAARGRDLEPADMSRRGRRPFRHIGTYESRSQGHPPWGMYRHPPAEHDWMSSDGALPFRVQLSLSGSCATGLSGSGQLPDASRVDRRYEDASGVLCADAWPCHTSGQ